METKDLPREKVILLEKELSEMKKNTKRDKIRRCIRNIIYIATLILVIFSIFLMTNAKKVYAGAPVSDDPNFTTQPTEPTVMERKIAELQGQVS